MPLNMKSPTQRDKRGVTGASHPEGKMKSREKRRYGSPEDVERLVRAFQQRRLPYAKWTHQAHLVVGVWYLSHYGLNEAIRRLRKGIRRYNVACGISNSDTSGYHETITCFYLRVIRRFLERRPSGEALHTVANALSHGPLASTSLPLEFYTRERLFSLAARRGWLEPDLKSLR